MVIDRPITFPEVLYKRRKLRSHGNIITRRGMSSISQVAGNIFVLNVFVLEILRPVIMGFKWWHYILCQPWISKEVEWAIDYLDIKKDILLMWTPVSAGIAKHIDTHLKVFDILDNSSRAFLLISVWATLERPKPSLVLLKSQGTACWLGITATTLLSALVTGLPCHVMWSGNSGSAAT